MADTINEMKPVDVLAGMDGPAREIVSMLLTQLRPLFLPEEMGQHPEVSWREADGIRTTMSLIGGQP